MKDNPGEFADYSQVRESDKIRTEFIDKFGPKKLAALKDGELLHYMFINRYNRDNLCNCLERRIPYTFFGSIRGGFSFKFGLYQRKEDDKWISGSSRAHQEIAEEEALTKGKKIRDFLVKGYDTIAKTCLEYVEDYNNLEKALLELHDEVEIHAWIKKYYFMMFPEKFAPFYTPDWLNHFFNRMGCAPLSLFTMSGTLALAREQANMPVPYFHETCKKIFGDPPGKYKDGIKGIL